jgi:hypothetical protein
MNRDAIKQSRLLKRWAPLLESGSTIESSNTKKVLAQVFENTYKEFSRHGLLTEAKFPGARADVTGANPINAKGEQTAGFMDGNNFFMPNVIMPMLRRIFPDLIANELVGVQAMNGPVGIALALRATYGGNSDREIGFNSPDTAFTGAQGEFLTDKLSGYAGDGADLSAWAGEGAYTSATTEFASFSSTETGLVNGAYPQASFGLKQATVTAKTRKIGGQWSPELAEDMEAMHGIDVENEMVNILSYEIGAEIDRQILTEMVKAAIRGGAKTVWDPAKADGLDQMGRLATLLTEITTYANQIALRTRRGAANFVVASPRVTAALQQMGMNKFVSFSGGKAIPSVPYSGVGALQKQGLINDGCQLLVRDAYAQGDYVLLGYKGTHPGDAGIIYCPYIPVQISKAINPDTMTPVIGVRTRYGIMNSVWDAERYYHYIDVKNIAGGSEYSIAGGRTFTASAPVYNEKYPMPY